MSFLLWVPIRALGQGVATEGRHGRGDPAWSPRIRAATWDRPYNVEEDLAQRRRQARIRRRLSPLQRASRRYVYV